MLLFASLQLFLQMCDDRNAKMKQNHFLYWFQSRQMLVNYSPRVCLRWKTQTKGCLATVHFRWYGTEQISVWLFYEINVSGFVSFNILLIQVSYFASKMHLWNYRWVICFHCFDMVLQHQILALDYLESWGLFNVCSI